MPVTDTGAAAPELPYDASISFETANVVALVFLPVALLPLALHALAWSVPATVHGFGDVFSWWLLPGFVASVVAHEALHAVGFLLGGAPRGALHFGIDRKTFSPFAGCRAPLKARAYRFAVFLPALALGVVPAIGGIRTGTAWMTVWGAFMLLCAGGDFAALWAMRAVPSGARVLDHSDRVGCRVVG